MSSLWTKTLVAGAAENAVTTGLSTFAGSLVLTTTPTTKDIVAAGVAAGISVLYTFAKGLGAAQSSTSSSTSSTSTSSPATTTTPAPAAASQPSPAPAVSPAPAASPT